MCRETFLLFTLAALGLYGCPSDDACATDADCFAGEVCAQGHCAPDDGGNGGPGEDGGADEDGGDGSDDGGRDDDGGSGGDGDSDTDSNTGSDTDSGTDMQPGTCEVDPFTYQCSDDGYEEDDEWIDGTKLVGETVGCSPDFQPVDETFVATMCPLDGSDWFYVDFRSCDGMDYVLEFQLEVDEECAGVGDIQFEPLSFECSEDFVQCTEVDGVPTIRMIVSDTLANLQSSYVRVHISDRDDLTFDYRLRVVVRE